LAFWRRPANKTLLLAGLACGVAALAGGGIKAAGFEFPLLTAGVSRWGLAGLAVVLVLASFYVRFGGEDAKDSSPLHGRRRSLSAFEPAQAADRTDTAYRLALLEAVEAQYRGELRSLLPSEERIPVEFDAYRLVSPQLGFRGRISATRDLEKAYRQSCPGPGTGGRLLIVGDPGSGK